MKNLKDMPAPKNPKKYKIWKENLKKTHNSVCDRNLTHCFQKGHPFYGSGKGQFKKGHKAWNTGKKYKQTEKARNNIIKALIGRKHSDITKEKLSKAKLREKNPSWQGGISKEPYSFDFDEALKELVKRRDNYVCQLCSQYGNTVHHIDYNKKNCNPTNLITLCKRCNSKVNFNRKYWIKYFQKTMEQYP